MERESSLRKQHRDLSVSRRPSGVDRGPAQDRRSHWSSGSTSAESGLGWGDGSARIWSPVDSSKVAMCLMFFVCYDAVHYGPKTYMSSDWRFVPFDPLRPFAMPPPICTPLATTNVFSVSMRFS